MSYGSDAAETDRLVGIYAGRILKGDKPTDSRGWSAAPIKRHYRIAAIDRRLFTAQLLLQQPQRAPTPRGRRSADRWHRS
jgi:hypothetical protein